LVWRALTFDEEKTNSMRRGIIRGPKALYKNVGEIAQGNISTFNSLTRRK